MEFFQQFPPPFNMIVAIVALVMATQIVVGVAKQIRRGVAHALDLNFKRTMIDRGLGVEEIERLLAAKSPSENDGGCCASRRESQYAVAAGEASTTPWNRS